MTLRNWLKESKISIKAFSLLIKRHRTYIHMMMGGLIPSDKVMKRIAEVTRQEVSRKEDLKDG